MIGTRAHRNMPHGARPPGSLTYPRGHDGARTRRNSTLGQKALVSRQRLRDRNAHADRTDRKDSWRDDHGAGLGPGTDRSGVPPDPAALGDHGVLCFPRQRLDNDAACRASAAMFGELEINVANAVPRAGPPEVMVLSNINQGRQAGRRSTTPARAGTPTCPTATTSRSPTCCYAIKCRCATASRWATPSSATCTPPTRTCPTDSSTGWKAAPPRTTSPSSGT